MAESVGEPTIIEPNTSGVIRTEACHWDVILATTKRPTESSLDERCRIKIMKADLSSAVRIRKDSVRVFPGVMTFLLFLYKDVCGMLNLNKFENNF